MSWLNLIFSDANHIIATATLLLAIAAVAQFELTRRTAQRQLRAYVSVDTTTIIDGTNLAPPPPIDRTDQPGIWIVIKNAGSTPANRVIHWGTMDVSTLDRENTFAAPKKMVTSPTSYILPGGACTKGLWLNRQLSEQEKTDIRAGSRAIYVYGAIEYVDVFKRKRRTEYRLKYSGSPWPPLGNNAALSFCDTGNHAS
jgi:hypothetical protein